MVDRIPDIASRMRGVTQQQLRGIRRGIEKESLRMGGNGSLSLMPHPAGLGSALTHPSITTDFCESQLELVTGAHASVESCLGELRQIHQFVYRQIDEEQLWVGSMPCGLPVDETIPIARFGTSNIGRAKSVYRVGLGHRYGRRMQVISGIHYNWSMPGLGTQDYFNLMRNFRRHSFLLLLLQGASPAVCSSFVADRVHGLLPMNGGTLGLPHATSLRMGRLGYQSDAQAALSVSYNSLEPYAASLEHALTDPHPDYASIGIHGAAGEYNQLSTSLLQIENEFYSTIRPKRVIEAGERPLHALRARGVEYIEVRCIDLDPFEPVGISETMARFLDLFLMHCHLVPSPPDSPEEIAILRRNQTLTTEKGREPGLMLERQGRPIGIVQWSRELLEEIAPIATALEAAVGGGYDDALRAMERMLDDPSELPSARMVERIGRSRDSSYLRLIKAQSEWARQQVLELPWSDEINAKYRRIAASSIAEQQRIEAADAVSFEEFRMNYISPARLKA